MKQQLTEHELTAAKFKLTGALILLAAMCVLSLLTGCVKSTADTNDDSLNAGDPSLYLDRATGCEYLSSGGRGITPRIAADGKTHLGCNGGQP